MISNEELSLLKEVNRVLEFAESFQDQHRRMNAMIQKYAKLQQTAKRKAVLTEEQSKELWIDREVNKLSLNRLQRKYKVSVPTILKYLQAYELIYTLKEIPENESGSIDMCL